MPSLLGLAELLSRARPAADAERAERLYRRAQALLEAAVAAESGAGEERAALAQCFEGRARLALRRGEEDSEGGGGGEGAALGLYLGAVAAWPEGSGELMGFLLRRFRAAISAARRADAAARRDGEEEAAPGPGPAAGGEGAVAAVSDRRLQVPGPTRLRRPARRADMAAAPLAGYLAGNWSAPPAGRPAGAFR